MAIAVPTDENTGEVEQWLAAERNQASPLLQMWWRCVDYKVGVVPAPTFVLILAVVVGFLGAGSSAGFPSDILMNIAVLSVGGFACAEIGKRLPLLNQIGTAAIFATSVSYTHLTLPTNREV